MAEDERPNREHPNAFAANYLFTHDKVACGL